MLAPTVARTNVVLMLHAGTPLRAGTIASLAGLPRQVAVSALDTLERRGVARRVRRLDHDEYEPDRDSPHFPAAHLAALADLPLDEALADERVDAVFAYGSLATPGAAGPESDLDLLVIGRVRDPRQVSARLQELGARLGRAVDAIFLTPEQVREARESGDPHVASALAGLRIRGTWSA